MTGYAARARRRRTPARRKARASPRLLLDGDVDSPRSIGEIEARGGIIATFVELRPYLKPNAPPFHEPHRRFFRIEPPPDVAAATDVAAAAAPYLSADTLVTGPFGPVQLWAVLVIPKGFVDGSESAEYITDDTRRICLREFLRVPLDARTETHPTPPPYVPRNEIDGVVNAAGTHQDHRSRARTSGRALQRAPVQR